MKRPSSRSAKYASVKKTRDRAGDNADILTVHAICAATGKMDLEYTPADLASTLIAGVPYREIVGLGRDKRAKAFRRDPSYRELEERLLGIGGNRVDFRLEPDLATLLAHGNAYRPDRRVFESMSNSCHENASELWVRDYPDTDIVTGWALSDDGCWRQHTWGFRPEGGTWVETTEPRIAGYGIALVGQEALQFAIENASPARMADQIGCLVEAQPFLLAS
jgi:hypothetical protein